MKTFRRRRRSKRSGCPSAPRGSSSGVWFRRLPCVCVAKHLPTFTPHVDPVTTSSSSTPTRLSSPATSTTTRSTTGTPAIRAVIKERTARKILEGRFERVLEKAVRHAAARPLAWSAADALKIWRRRDSSARGPAAGGHRRCCSTVRTRGSDPWPIFSPSMGAGRCRRCRWRP